MGSLTFRNVFDEVLDKVNSDNPKGLKEMCRKYNFKSVNDCVIYVPSWEMGMIVCGDTSYRELLRNATEESGFFFLDDNAQVSHLNGLEFDIVRERNDFSWKISDFYSLRRKSNFLHTMQSFETQNPYESGERMLSYLLGRELTIIDKMIIGKVSIPKGPRTRECRHSHDSGYIMPKKYEDKKILKRFHLMFSPEAKTPLTHENQSYVSNGILNLL